MSLPQDAASSRRGEHAAWIYMFLLLALAVTVRLALLPYASQDTDDHPLRVWIAWRWGEDPFFFLHGHWPPLHFFLLGAVIRWFDDPILAPVLVQVAFGALVPAVLYLFSVREWGSRNAALAVGAAFALYPVAIRTSLEVLAQPLFSLFTALTFLALSYARAPSATWRQAAVAGTMLTLAALFRVEGWILIPFFALTLWPRLPQIIVFGAVASIAPVAIMIANTLHYGDPIFTITTVTDFELNLAGRENYTILQHAGQVIRYVRLVVGGMTPVLALFCVLGVISCVARRERQAVWLIPALGMGLVLLTSVARGTTGPKLIYTETLGLLLIPFLASFLVAPDLRRLPRAATTGAYAALFGSMLFLLVIGTLRDIPGMRERSRVVAAIPSLNAAPSFPGKGIVDKFLPVIQAGDGDRQGLVLDTLGSPATPIWGSTVSTIPTGSSSPRTRPTPTSTPVCLKACARCGSAGSPFEILTHWTSTSSFGPTARVSWCFSPAPASLSGSATANRTARHIMESSSISKRWPGGHGRCRWMRDCGRPMCPQRQAERWSCFATPSRTVPPSIVEKSRKGPTQRTERDQLVVVSFLQGSGRPRHVNGLHPCEVCAAGHAARNRCDRRRVRSGEPRSPPAWARPQSANATGLPRTMRSRSR